MLCVAIFSLEGFPRRVLSEVAGAGCRARTMCLVDGACCPADHQRDHERSHQACKSVTTPRRSVSMMKGQQQLAAT